MHINVIRKQSSAHSTVDHTSAAKQRRVHNPSVGAAWDERCSEASPVLIGRRSKETVLAGRSSRPQAPVLVVQYPGIWCLIKQSQVFFLLLLLPAVAVKQKQNAVQYQHFTRFQEKASQTDRRSFFHPFQIISMGVCFHFFRQQGPNRTRHMRYQQLRKIHTILEHNSRAFVSSSLTNTYSHVPNVLRTGVKLSADLYIRHSHVPRSLVWKTYSSYSKDFIF